MIYFEKEKRYRKIKDVADEIAIERKKIYECVRDMENQHLTKFKKTAYGAYLIEDEQIKDLKEYAVMKSFKLSPKGIAENIRVRRELEKQKQIGKDQENMEWAKGLGYAVWRNF